MEINIYRYRFPFKQPFTTASASFTVREGLIFVLNHDGIEAYGEAAPLPGFSRESLTDILRFLNKSWHSLHNHIEKQIEKDDLPELSSAPQLPASLAFALDTLAADYWAKRKKIPLRKLLFKKSMSEIAVNSTLAMDNTQQLLHRAQRLWEAGYRTIKLKTGAEFDKEFDVINQLRNRFPALNIRIDANQGWSYDEAVTRLEYLTPLNIEYCEEPLSHSTPETFKKLEDISDIPIALDESLYQFENYEPWFETECAEILIMKPMVLGGFKKNFETFRLAADHEYTIIFTTSLESVIGRMMTATLTAGLGSAQFAHGLATGTHLELDAWDDQNYLKKGQLNLPGKEGLSNKFDPDSLGPAVEKLDI